MSKLLEEFTRERLEYYANLPTQPFGDDASVFMYEVRKLARIALEAKCAEPKMWDVTFIPPTKGGNAFTVRYHSIDEVNHWKDLHELAGFGVSVKPLIITEVNG